VLAPARRASNRATVEWESLDARTQGAVKLAVLVLATVAAYHYSLTTILSTLTADTPLAYLGLVPVIAAALAWIHRVPRRAEPPIHDRQLDYTIGIPLMVAAVAAANLLPERLGAMAWVNRLDLLFMPVFVIGATVLLFGARVAWRQRGALGYLFLIWPWPYASVLLGAFDGFRTLTLKALDMVLHVVSVGTPIGAAGEGQYQVVHHGQAFTISVVTACSGVNGMVGFLLIGIALVLCSRGALLRKTLWIAAGLVWLWVLNVVRLLIVFAIGAHWGEHMAIAVVHPVIGLVIFAVGVVAIVAVMPRFGIEFAGPTHAASGRRAGGPATKSVRLVAVLVLAASVVVATGNAALARFDPVANAAGEPRLSSFLVNPAAPAHYRAAFQSEIHDQALFGASSRWFRYAYTSTTTQRGTLPVTADIVDESGLSGFEAYGVTACYSFHGYELHDVESVDLGNGVSGQALSYSDRTSNLNWSIVWWIVPVRTGEGTRYERVILYLQNTGTNRLSSNRKFLVHFANGVIAGQRSHRDYDVQLSVFQQPGAARAAWEADAAPGGHHLDAHDSFWRRYLAKHHAKSEVKK
jgi:exosortase/archaeosortase family protein